MSFSGSVALHSQCKICEHRLVEFNFGLLGVTEPVGSIREHVIIEVPPDLVWSRIADVENNSSWFTSLQTSWCDLDNATGRPVRMVVGGTGLAMTEDIIRVDSVQRRLQYRLRPIGFITHHLATIDVLDVTDLTGAPTSMVVYSTELSPAPLAVAFGGATRQALDTLKTQTEAAWASQKVGA